MKNYTKDKEDSIKIRLSLELKQRYVNYCKMSGIKMSEKIRELLENELKNGR